MKKFIVLLYILFLFLWINTVSNAASSQNVINNITIDIDIQNNGDAIVTEFWNCNIGYNTYLYHRHPFFQIHLQI